MPDGWDELLSWGRVLTGVVDLDEGEHSYKRSLAARMQRVRSQFLERADGWTGELVTELESTNLLNWRLTYQVRGAASERPGALAAAVATVWEMNEADASALGRFEPAVREAVPAIAPGNVVAFGSILLMARDPSRFPPYRPSPVTRWREVVGGDAPEPNAVARYTELLGLTDELLERAPGAGITLADRLEAQGLAWSVLQWKVADLPLSDTERRALASWRGDKDFLAIPDEVERTVASDARAVDEIITGRGTCERTLAEIHVRRGQAEFRRALLSAYGARCAVTGSATEAVLEAAHIHPYRGGHTNMVTNGLLLRADIHTLFDLCLLTVTVEGGRYIVRVGPAVTEPAYRALDGQPLRVLPKSRNALPSRRLLADHNAACDWLG